MRILCSTHTTFLTPSWRGWENNTYSRGTLPTTSWCSTKSTSKIKFSLSQKDMYQLVASYTHCFDSNFRMITLLVFNWWCWRAIRASLFCTLLSERIRCYSCFVSFESDQTVKKSGLKSRSWNMNTVLYEVWFTHCYCRLYYHVSK